MTVGQAIRREVAAMGDGVERALARAAELESLVHNEVSALERAYNDNEVRIRDLLSELTNQRETLVNQAEHVRNAIASVHLDLSHDITSVGDLVADKVNDVAQRVTRSLTEKGEHITLALGHVGDSHDRHADRARLDFARPAGDHRRPRQHRHCRPPATPHGQPQFQDRDTCTTNSPTSPPACSR